MTSFFAQISILRMALTIAVVAIIGFFTSRFVNSDNIEKYLKNIAGSEKTLQNAKIYGESIRSPIQVAALYKQNSYQPFWMHNKELPAITKDLLKAINNAEYDGLQEQWYHARTIEKILNDINNIPHSSVDSLAQTDILLTDAFVSYAIHLYAGTISGKGMNRNRQTHLKKLDLFAALNSAITHKKVFQDLISFSNTSPAYQLLKHNLLAYKLIQDNGGFPVLPKHIELVLGDTSVHIPKLCKRLQMSNDLKGSYITRSYDSVVWRAVKHFQYHHGLPETGILTKETIVELNLPVEDRIRQIELNMERWRWLPRNHEDTVIMINIPGFTMEVYEQMHRKFGMRAIVGKEYTKTPVFYATMQYLVINPYWEVPQSIAVQEILPLLKKNSGYLSKNHMLLYEKSGVAQPINPDNINWSKVSAHNFPYRIRQKPGEWNALGEIKFIFPNPYNVYLHGTPTVSLFEKPVRAFSHGCMRIENPVMLAAYLLNDSTNWSEEKIRKKIRTRNEKRVNLPNKTPVYVCYWTCWPDVNGELCFRRDVYGHDNLLTQAF